MRVSRFGGLHGVGLAQEDRAKLEAIVKKALEMTDGTDEEAERAAKIDVAAFEGMIARDRPLSDKQRAWVGAIYEQLFDEPQYLNLASSGKLCRGREVPTPAVLQNLPKKPPRRRTDAEEES
jgi:hypothetical protein